MLHKGIETSYALLASYEVLAIQYRHSNNPRGAYPEEGETELFPAIPPMNYGNYGFTIALLNINAAIVEGVMRSVLSEIVSEEVDSQAKARGQSGRTERSSSENLLNKFYIEVDAQGGWEKLKEQYASYLGLSIDKAILPQTKEAISTLFVLRNTLAHGTTMRHPSEPVSEDLKDEPIFKWQSRLQGARIYLENQFHHDDIFENLAEFCVPEHFLQKTKEFLSEIIPIINHKPQGAKRTIAAIHSLQFGYRNIE